MKTSSMRNHFNRINYGSLGTMYPSIDGSQQFVRTENGNLHCRIAASLPEWTTYRVIPRQWERAVLAVRPSEPIFHVAVREPVKR